MSKHLLISCAVIAICAVPGARAIAQDMTATPDPVTPANPNAAQPGSEVPRSAPAAEAPASDVPQGGLTDIIVTAQRRNENLQRAAIAVSSVGGDALRDAQVVNPAQLTAVVPALQVASSNSSFNYYLRGVGNVNGNPLSESAIAFNFGGVYVGRPVSSAAFFYDIERVEVLKGPQGTLYGRNATGGAINVIPKAPEETFGGDASIEYGNYATLNAQAAGNVPLGEGTALRAAGFVARHDGYMDDGTDDQKDYGGRLTLVTRPVDDLKITVLADYAHQGGRGAGATPVDLGIGGRDGVSSTAGQAFYRSQTQTLGGRNFVGIPPLQYQRNDFYGISATVDWQTPIGTLTVIPAYRRSEVDAQSSTVGFLITEMDRTKEKSLEARFASDESNPLRVLLGLYVYHSDTSVPLFLVNNQFDYTRQTFATATNSRAAFGRLTYEVIPGLRLNGGLRYTNEKKRLNGTDLILDRVCLGGIGACPNAVPFTYGDLSPPNIALVPDGTVVPQPGVDGTLQVGTLINVANAATFNKLTWRAGVDWDVAPHSLMYASYETGFKSGGFFFTHDAGIYRPETINAFTLGSKNRFLDNRLQLNVEGFWWTYKDQQISHVALDSAGSAVLPTENVGRARIRGIEGEARFLVTPHTLLGADVQFLDAKYRDFVYNVPNFGGPPATTCPSTLTGLNYAVDCSGNRLPQAPKWTVNLTAEQTIDLAASGKLVVSGRTHHQSSTLTSLEFLPDEYQRAYATFDAAVNWTAGDGKLRAGLFVNNLTNKTIQGGAFIPPFSATNFVVGILRPPRLYGVRAGYNF